jgi:hypothetical protein
MRAFFAPQSTVRFLNDDLCRLLVLVFVLELVAVSKPHKAFRQWIINIMGVRYLNEFSFRLNRKELAMLEVFSDVVDGIAKTDQLPYKVFTA